MGTYTYTVTETDTKADGWTYDVTEYTVTVEVAKVSGKLEVCITKIEKDGQEISVPTPYEDDEVGFGNLIVFTNTYAPDTTGTPDNPDIPDASDTTTPDEFDDDDDDDPSPTPSNPSTSSTPITLNNTVTDPPVDVPDEDVPLADIPVEDTPVVTVPDEDVPLADVPDEDVPLVDVPDEDVPLTDIPDESVPLNDVPQTGDNFMIWVVMLLLSGMGLAWLALTGKKRVK